MKNIITLASVNNERVKYFLSLTDKKTRNKEQKLKERLFHSLEP